MAEIRLKHGIVEGIEMIDETKIEEQVECMINFISELETDVRYSLAVYLLRTTIHEMREVAYGVVPVLRIVPHVGLSFEKLGED